MTQSEDSYKPKSSDNLPLGKPSEEHARAIPVSKGHTAWVSARDFDRVSKFTWWAIEQRHTTYAAARTEKGVRKLVYLHRFILGESHSEIDHRDGDGLNNTRKNLRPATRCQNQAWKRISPANRISKFRGVLWHKGNGKWRAKVSFHNREIDLGYFATEEVAAKFRDLVAVALHGSFSRTNNV